MYQGFQSAFWVGIDPQSLSYRFLNEIMDNPCSDGDPESDKIGCTKFNEKCTKFYEGCTKGSKVRSEMGINPQSLSYGFSTEIMDHPCSDGGPESDMIGYTEFCKGCTKGSKVHSEVGSTPKHFLIHSKMKLWTIHIQMDVPKAI